MTKSERGNQPRRDFAGRGLLINLARVVHLVGLALLAASLLGAAGEMQRAAVLMLVSGLAIIALDVWANPAWLREVVGIATVFKLVLVALLFAGDVARLPLFWIVLAFSVLLSHGPGKLRHRRLF
ncbi:MAG: hypothetical protein CVU17_09885 [Betaproteobacteria bacterium HGW-Betaproteobacteria-11]|nr:MAG: hypothetical protein CVU17_09885 [Betaproteobacteria bacterium HGW-Betaproteobacteria-11]